MSTNASWKFLSRKPKSLYKQLFIHDEGRWVSARTIYGQAVGDGARTREQLAEDYNLPLEAVQAAIAYCESGPPGNRPGLGGRRGSAGCRRHDGAELQIPREAPAAFATGDGPAQPLTTGLAVTNRNNQPQDRFARPIVAMAPLLNSRRSSSTPSLKITPFCGMCETISKGLSASITPCTISAPVVLLRNGSRTLKTR